MNCQVKPEIFSDQIQKEIAEVFDKNGIEVIESELNYFAWPQLFGSTSGPKGGIGGCALTTMTVHAFEYAGAAVLVCSGILLFTDRFKPLMRFKTI